MRTLHLRAALAAAAALTPAVHADIVWTGAVSSDVFDEANWDLSNSTVTTIDPNVGIEDDIVIANASSEVWIPDVSGQQRFQVGDGFTVTIDNSTVRALGNDGLGGQPGASPGPLVTLRNGASFEAFFIVNGTHMVFEPGTHGVFNGGFVPINASTVDLAPGSYLHFTDETPNAYISEHLNKTTVLGVPAVVGGNVQVASDGGAGCFVTVIAPIGTNVCGPATPNSSFQSASIRATGTDLVALNNLALLADGCPPNELGYFLCGQASGYLPGVGGSQGALCILGRIGRFAAQIQSTGPNGELGLVIDNTTLPVWPRHAVSPGETWVFQAWFADGASSNFTDALVVQFQ